MPPTPGEEEGREEGSMEEGRWEDSVLGGWTSQPEFEKAMLKAGTSTIVSFAVL